MKIQNKIIYIFAIIICFFVLDLRNVNAATLGKPANNLGLVEYLSFNEGTTTTAQDFSGNINTGTLINMSHPASETSGWGAGYAGSGVVFDGTDDYITFDGVADNVTQTSFSISMWVKTTWTAGFFTLWAVNTNAYGNETQIYLDSTNFVKVYDGTTDATEITSSKIVGDNKWHHVVYTRSGATGTLYVDGVSQGTHTGNDTFSTNDRWSLGQEWDVGPVTSDFFKGNLDEVRVYSRVLSQSDITALYNSGGVKIGSSNSNLIRNGLVSHWTFDGKDTTDKIYDVVGGNHGYLPAGATTSSKTIGKLGQALSFNGTDREVDIADNASLNLDTSFTVLAWIKRQGTSWSPIFDASASLGWVFQISDTNKITYTETAVNDYMGTSNVQNGVWQHVAVVKNGNGASNTTFYLNGVADGTASTDTVITPSGIKKIGYDNSFFFNGSIDDVRVYNRALTAAEVKQLYDFTSGAKINSSSVYNGGTLKNSLVGYWSFNGIDFTDKIYDRSSNTNNGYLYNGPTTTAKTTGKLGQGIVFDGVDDVTVHNVSSLGTLSSGSVSLWIYRNTNANYEILLEDGVSNLSFEGDSLFSMWTGNSCQVNFSSIPLNQWNHLVGTWNGTTNRVYLNGVQSSSGACTNTPSALTSISVGGRWNGSSASSNYKGKVDEIRLYSRALTATEVKELYLQGR